MTEPMDPKKRKPRLTYVSGPEGRKYVNDKILRNLASSQPVNSYGTYIAYNTTDKNPEYNIDVFDDPMLSGAQSQEEGAFDEGEIGEGFQISHLAAQAQQMQEQQAQDGHDTYSSYGPPQEQPAGQQEEYSELGHQGEHGYPAQEGYPEQQAYSEQGHQMPSYQEAAYQEPQQSQYPPQQAQYQEFQDQYQQQAQQQTPVQPFPEESIEQISPRYQQQQSGQHMPYQQTVQPFQQPPQGYPGPHGQMGAPPPLPLPNQPVQYPFGQNAPPPPFPSHGQPQQYQQPTAQQMPPGFPNQQQPQPYPQQQQQPFPQQQQQPFPQQQQQPFPQQQQQPFPQQQQQPFPQQQQQPFPQQQQQPFPQQQQQPFPQQQQPFPQQQQPFPQQQQPFPQQQQPFPQQQQQFAQQQQQVYQNQVPQPNLGEQGSFNQMTQQPQAPVHQQPPAQASLASPASSWLRSYGGAAAGAGNPQIADWLKPESQAVQLEQTPVETVGHRLTFSELSLPELPSEPKPEPELQPQPEPQPAPPEAVVSPPVWTRVSIDAAMLSIQEAGLQMSRMSSIVPQSISYLSEVYDQSFVVHTHIEHVPVESGAVETDRVAHSEELHVEEEQVEIAAPPLPEPSPVVPVEEKTVEVQPEIVESKVEEPAPKASTNDAPSWIFKLGKDGRVETPGNDEPTPAPQAPVPPVTVEAAPVEVVAETVAPEPTVEAPIEAVEHSEVAPVQSEPVSVLSDSPQAWSQSFASAVQESEIMPPPAPPVEAIPIETTVEEPPMVDTVAPEEIAPAPISVESSKPKGKGPDIEWGDSPTDSSSTSNEEYKRLLGGLFKNEADFSAPPAVSKAKSNKPSKVKKPTKQPTKKKTVDEPEQPYDPNNAKTSIFRIPTAGVVRSSRGTVELLVHKGGRTFRPHYNPVGILLKVDVSDGFSLVRGDTGKSHWQMLDRDGNELEEEEILTVAFDKVGNLWYETDQKKRTTFLIDGSVEVSTIYSGEQDQPKLIDY